MKFQKIRIKNTAITPLEHLGLEALLQKIITAYEEEYIGAKPGDVTYIATNTRWTDRGIEIVDGGYDVYPLNDFLVRELILSDGCCILVGFKVDDDFDVDHPLDSMLDVTEYQHQITVDIDKIIKKIEEIK